MNNIEVLNARTNNLKNISLVIPRDKLVVITGPSGCGKSSLAFDTLYAEGQRRYVESLSTHARQFLPLMKKPDVDHIKGLSPTISIGQRYKSHISRSTVGTITEIQDYLCLFFACIGEPRCPDHHIPLTAYTISQMVDIVLSKQLEGKKLMLLAPIIKESDGEHGKILESLLGQGYIRARIDGKIYDLSASLKLNLQGKHTIEVVIDRFKVCDDLAQRLAESFETALSLSTGTALVVNMDNEKKEELLLSTNFACSICGYSIPKLKSRFFSFNNPSGACFACNGLGVQQYFNCDLVSKNKDIPLADDAIHSWGHTNPYHFQRTLSLAENYKFNLKELLQILDQHQTIQKKFLFRSSRKENNREIKYTSVCKELAKYIINRPCTHCNGTRLRREARQVFVEHTTLPEVSEMSIGRVLSFFNDIKLSGQQVKIAEKVRKEICDRLNFLVKVGLSYLSLSRPAETLSSGEAQRIRLASQIGAGLVGVTYILDEPSIGLHQRDNERLLEMLIHLRDLGNTVIVVEHDEKAIRSADHIIDIGPGAGVHGGEVIAQGTTEEIMAHPISLTGQFLSGKQQIAIPQERISADPTRVLKLVGARGNNLKDVTLILPVGLFTCVTGVSGSGKSTLINDTLLPIVKSQFYGSNNTKISPYRDVQGLKHFEKVIYINHNPMIGWALNSNPATYTGIFTLVRELFASVPQSRARGYMPVRFSFNVRGGRCETCLGKGIIKIEMYFLPDIYIQCDQCNGQRYNRETLEVRYKGKNIHQVLEMTIKEAREFFDTIPTLAIKLQTQIDAGLSYIRLGQSANTLSKGEAQRVKLARELSKRGTGQTLYILDEPTTGLHFADIQQLLTILYQLRNQGNTIVVIEHNLDVIKTADWIIDLGPEGGDNGGEILIAGTPETVAGCEISYTGRSLRPILG